MLHLSSGIIHHPMPAIFIENRTYDEIKVGDSATLTRTLRPEDIQLFAIMSGDVNPAHVDPEYAHSSLFQEVIAHGMWGGALISTVLGTEFPGPGTIYIGQTLKFSRPVKVGDTITVKVTCKEKFDRNKHIVFECLCTNQDGLKVIAGEAEVLAPTEKVKRERFELPEFTISDRWRPTCGRRRLRAAGARRVAAERGDRGRIGLPAPGTDRTGERDARSGEGERYRPPALPPARCAARPRSRGARRGNGTLRRSRHPRAGRRHHPGFHGARHRP
jgi:acyl dehydratase